MSTFHKSKAAGLTASFFASVLLVSTAADAANHRHPARGKKTAPVATSPVVGAPTPLPVVSVNPAPPPVILVAPMPAVSVNPAPPAVISVAP